MTWKETEGVWTSVEVNVKGETHKELNDGKQHIIITGFQPARTYEVSLTSLSGNERRSEPYVFSCSTDPRGESKPPFQCVSWSKIWIIHNCFSIYRLFWFVLPTGVIAGSICAVLIFGILVLLVFLFLKRPEMIRLVLHLWLYYPPQTYLFIRLDHWNSPILFQRRNKSLIGGSKLSNKSQIK